MNDRDSELLTGLMLKDGYQLAKSEQEADVILFNGCSVRKHAEDRVWSQIGNLKKLKQKKYKRIIGLIGCMAQNWQQSAFSKSKLINLVVGPNNIDSIPELIETIRNGHSIGLAVGKEKRDDIVYNTEYIADKSHCSVNITEGCNNFCSYCIVPYVRGPERSRPAGDIITEINKLIKKGIRQITLLGQNVNSYKSDNIDFIGLIKMVNEIKGLEGFDFVTSHPKDANEGLFKAMASLAKCKKSLHLPVQSGSDRILKLMNRRYTSSHYINLAKKARKIIDGLRLTTDIMVGFPTEKDEDFKDTYDLMQEVKFDAAYIFKYSPRLHTKACEYPDDVALDIKKKRNQVLLAYQKKLHKERKHV